MTQIPRTGMSDTAITESLPVCPECGLRHAWNARHSKGCKGCARDKRQGRRVGVLCPHFCLDPDCGEQCEMTRAGRPLSQWCEKHSPSRLMGTAPVDLEAGRALFARTARIGAIGGPTGEPHV